MRKKVYCGECKNYFEGRKGEEECLVAEIVPLPLTENYRQRAEKRKRLCWEKNQGNDCEDYEEK